MLEMNLAIIGGAAIILMMLLIVTDVLLRNIINSPIRGGKELVELLMIIFIFFGISFTQKSKGHIGIDFVQNVLRGLTKKITVVINLILSILASGLLTYFLYHQLIDDYNRGVATIYLQWPQWILTLFIFIGMLTLTIRLILEIQEMFQSKKDKSEEGGHSD